MENIIRHKLTTALSPIILDIVDESHLHAGHAGARPGGNSHFKIHIVSHKFIQMTRLERHRLVHTLLQEELESTLHALSLTLRSPKEIS